MARVTIEDCLQYMGNGFDLVDLAAQRARKIADGARPLVTTDSEKAEKPAVVALREIADGLITSSDDLEALEAAHAQAVEVAAEHSSEVLQDEDGLQQQ